MSLLSVPVQFGYDPPQLRLNLTPPHGGFTATMRTRDGSDWPVGVSAVFLIGTGDGQASWGATVQDDKLVWNVDAADVAALPGATAHIETRVTLLYTDSDDNDITWMTGWVSWHGTG